MTAVPARLSARPSAFSTSGIAGRRSLRQASPMHGNAEEACPEFREGGGQMGALIRAHDWGTTPLGEPMAWPQPLKTLVGVMLASSQPMFIAWGSERVMLYNDGY